MASLVVQDMATNREPLSSANLSPGRAHYCVYYSVCVRPGSHVVRLSFCLGRLPRYPLPSQLRSVRILFRWVRSFAGHAILRGLGIRATGMLQTSPKRQAWRHRAPKWFLARSVLGISTLEQSSQTRWRQLLLPSRQCRCNQTLPWSVTLWLSCSRPRTDRSGLLYW